MTAEIIGGGGGEVVCGMVEGEVDCVGRSRECGGKWWERENNTRGRWRACRSAVGGGGREVVGWSGAGVEREQEGQSGQQ